MDSLVPVRNDLCALIEPVVLFPPVASDRDGRRPVNECELRMPMSIYLLQLWFNLSIGWGSPVLTRPSGLPRASTCRVAGPDETTVANSHLLEKPSGRGAVQGGEPARMSRQSGEPCTILDATSYSAPSSTKNKTGSVSGRCIRRQENMISDEGPTSEWK